MIVDCAVYDSGTRRAGDLPLEVALETAGASPDAFVWIGLHEPSPDEFDAVVKEFDLHPLAVEDALKPQQRPKLERYDNSLFLVLKTVRYVDPEEVVEVGQVVLFIGEGFVVSVRHGQSTALAQVRSALQRNPALLAHGPSAVLHAVLDRVVDDYIEVLPGFETDIEEIEQAVFSTSGQNHAERIYKLKREVLDFRHAVLPLAEPVAALEHGGLPCIATEIGPYFRDVSDHLARVAERIEAFDVLLTGALNANLAAVGVRQNEDMRKISAWVAILAVPTMIAGIYGMNFDHMPELEQVWGYPAVLVLMVTCCLVLYRAFKRNDWL